MRRKLMLCSLAVLVISGGAIGLRAQPNPSVDQCPEGARCTLQPGCQQCGPTKCTVGISGEIWMECLIVCGKPCPA
jgi:hypothetical protein